MEELEPGEVRRREVQVGVKIGGALEKRGRVVLSRWQVEVLEGLYRRSSSVTWGRMEVVARHLTLPTKSVRNWFKNRRQKDVREAKEVLEDKESVPKLEETLMPYPQYENQEEPGCDNEGSSVSLLTPKTELYHKED